MRVVKFNNANVYTCLQSHYGVRLNQFASKDKRLTEGPVVLSLKYKKRRKLVKGTIKLDAEHRHSYPGGFEEIFYFQPNNPTKFFSLFFIY